MSELKSLLEDEMKRLIGITILAGLILASCNSVASIVNPIIGTWETEIIGVTVSTTFNANESVTETNSLGQIGVTRDGTWTSDSNTLEKTWSDESVDKYTFSFNANNTTMTLAPYPTGVSITYDRQ